MADDKFHHDVSYVALFADIVDGDDVGVRKLTAGLRFTEQASSQFRSARVGSVVDCHGFDRHGPAYRRIDRAIDHSHAALADLFQEFVAAKSLGTGTRVRRGG